MELEVELLGRRHRFADRLGRRLPGQQPAGGRWAGARRAAATVEAILPLLAGLRAPPGRMQLVAQPPCRRRRPSSTTPTSPRPWPRRWRRCGPHTAGRLVVVFGCGGDRDAGKRPLMGEIAARLADRGRGHRRQPAHRGSRPRSGAAVLAAAPAPARSAAGGRRSAPPSPALRPGDTLLVAGKGHETYQIVGDRDAAVRRCRGAARRRACSRGRRRMTALWTAEAVAAATGGTIAGDWVASRRVDRHAARWRRATCSWRWRAPTTTATPSSPQRFERGAAAAVVEPDARGRRRPASLVLVGRHAGGAGRARPRRPAPHRARGSPASPAASARPAPRRRCATCWSRQAPTHASAASYNNHWGVPLEPGPAAARRPATACSSWA